MNSRWKTLIAMSAGLLLVGVVMAQDPAQRLREQQQPGQQQLGQQQLGQQQLGQQQQPGQTGAAAMQPGAQPGARTAGGSLDSHLAQCLTMDNQHQSAVADIAKQRSKDNDVKQFA